MFLPATKGEVASNEEAQKTSSVDDFIMRTFFPACEKKKAIWHRRALEIILIFANCSIIMDVLEWRNLHLKWNSNSFYLTALISSSCRLEYNPIKGWSVQLRPLLLRACFQSARHNCLSRSKAQLFLDVIHNSRSKIPEILEHSNPKLPRSKKVSDFIWVSRFRGLHWFYKRQQRISQGRRPIPNKKFSEIELFANIGEKTCWTSERFGEFNFNNLAILFWLSLVIRLAPIMI